MLFQVVDLETTLNLLIINKIGRITKDQPLNRYIQSLKDPTRLGAAIRENPLQLYQH